VNGCRLSNQNSSPERNYWRSEKPAPAAVGSDMNTGTNWKPTAFVDAAEPRARRKLRSACLSGRQPRCDDGRAPVPCLALAGAAMAGFCLACSSWAGNRAGWVRRRALLAQLGHVGTDGAGAASHCANNSVQVNEF